MRVTDFQIYAPDLPEPINRYLSACSEAGWLALRREPVQAREYRKLAIRLVRSGSGAHATLALKVAEVWVELDPGTLESLLSERTLPLRNVVEAAVDLLGDATRDSAPNLGRVLEEGIGDGPPYDEALPESAFVYAGRELHLRYRWDTTTSEVYVSDGGQLRVSVHRAVPFRPLDTVIRLKRPKIVADDLVLADPSGGILTTPLGFVRR